MINHHPTQQGVWFNYTGGRYKDVYDLRLKTGEVFHALRPNGNSWYPHFGSNAPRVIHDSEVDQVRLKLDEELTRFNAKGPGRIDRSMKLFGDAVPPGPQPISERQ